MPRCLVLKRQQLAGVFFVPYHRLLGCAFAFLSFLTRKINVLCRLTISIPRQDITLKRALV